MVASEYMYAYYHGKWKLKLCTCSMHSALSSTKHETFLPQLLDTCMLLANVLAYQCVSDELLPMSIIILCLLQFYVFIVVFSTLLKICYSQHLRTARSRSGMEWLLLRWLRSLLTLRLSLVSAICLYILAVASESHVTHCLHSYI